MSEKIIIPVDNTLSLAARGVLASMVNDPMCDYCTISSLCATFITNSMREIIDAVDELCNHGYITRMFDEVYVVNKNKITSMKQI